MDKFFHKIAVYTFFSFVVLMSTTRLWPSEEGFIMWALFYSLYVFLFTSIASMVAYIGINIWNLITLKSKK